MYKLSESNGQSSSNRIPAIYLFDRSAGMDAAWQEIVDTMPDCTLLDKFGRHSFPRRCTTIHLSIGIAIENVVEPGLADFTVEMFLEPSVVHVRNMAARGLLS